MLAVETEEFVEIKELRLAVVRSLVLLNRLLNELKLNPLALKLLKLNPLALKLLKLNEFGLKLLLPPDWDCWVMVWLNFFSMSLSFFILLISCCMESLDAETFWSFALTMAVRLAWRFW